MGSPPIAQSLRTGRSRKSENKMASIEITHNNRPVHHDRRRPSCFNHKTPITRNHRHNHHNHHNHHHHHHYHKRLPSRVRHLAPMFSWMLSKRRTVSNMTDAFLSLILALSIGTLLLCVSFVQTSASNPLFGAPASAASTTGVLNGADRVHVIRQPPAINPTSYKQTKQTFKENFEKIVIHVKENTPIGTKLTDVQPRDADNGALGTGRHLHGQQSAADKAIYAIVGGADQHSFTLRIDERDNKVELVNEVTFDYESGKKNYHIIIRATSLYLRYELEADILVEDENDNKPQLDDFAILFNNYKNNFPTGPIGRVPATDLDKSDALRYRVISGNNAQLIIVNETTGDIQLSPWLNSNVPLRAVMDVEVSDGFYEAVAKLVLTVNLVTESMLHNSVVLRLDGLSRDEFLSRKYDIFLNQMTRILGTSNLYSTNDIVVFDVEEGQHNGLTSNAAADQSGAVNSGSASITSAAVNDLAASASSPNYRTYHVSVTNTSSLYLNISFSARAEGNDVEAYLSRQYIEERISLNRFALSQNLDAQVAAFQDDICVNEPCQNYQECQLTYRFDKASKSFYNSTNIFFRSIKTAQSFTCVCPPTFTGMKNKNECNLQINQCFSNPCQNGGICHRHELGYTCECPLDYFGGQCEHSFTNSTCQTIGKPQMGISSAAGVSSGPGNAIAMSSALDDPFRSGASSVCGGKSRCVNLNKSHQHYYQKSATSSVSSASSGSTIGFTCQGCPFPSQWSTDLCQLRARSFDKNSYIVLPSLRRRHRFHLQVQFVTVQNDALLLYNGRFNDKHDFIALEIVDSRVKFSYSLGSASSFYSVTLATMPVSDGQWHKVAIDYRDRNVTLIIDDCDPVLDEALARIQPTSRRCSNTTYAPPTGAAEQQLGSDYTKLDLTSPMQVGAIPLTMLGASNNADEQQQQHLSSLMANSFSGCMGDLYIDHQLVDLSSPLQDSGTQPGCPEKRSFCQQHSCNGYPCQDLFGSAKCQCGDERLGKACEHYISQERVRKFSGNSYLTFNPIESQIPNNWQVSMHFRTINPNGILFKMSLDPEATIVLELSDGGLKLSHRSRSITLNKIQLDDGEWHFVELIWSPESTLLQADFNPNLSIQSNELGPVAGQTIRSVIVGASSTRYSPASVSTQSSPSSLTLSSAAPQPPPPPSSSSSLSQLDLSLARPETSAEFSNSDSPPPLPSTIATPTALADDYSNLYLYGLNGSQSFVGCIYGLNISDNSDWWQSPNDERNVERGCPVVDVCEASQCPANSRCVRKGMNQRRCICNPGHVGAQCLPVCELGPCQGENSRCLPVGSKNQSAHERQPGPEAPQQTSWKFSNPPLQQYTCECGPHRSGKNCEHQLSPRCPSNWWGKPISPGQNSSICGQCNCDESRGLDGDCDKTTGQCFCKPNHYKPPGSDYCLACDCYVVGSLSTSCNQTSGQCKCRPGVVGRRCDSCASSYAEVTLRGCEVIYDACPKTYSDGIWWDKTQLDRMATQQCPPSSSTGTATRFCHKTEGWQEAVLFDCISNTFTDLYTQYQFLEENKFQMTTNLAMKIASNLRNALNETISSLSMQLYGSDMYISFRLLHHLIQHELRQTGLNLTHRQDRLYIRNIVESISSILDPAYAKNWPEISARPPNRGAEYLLKLMDSYGKVLIDSQSDTFTQPFDITTKYFQFGMDTISIDQLYDMSKWSLSPAAGGPVAGFGPHSAAHLPSSPPYATDPFDNAAGGLSSPFGSMQSANPIGSSTRLNGQNAPTNGHFNADGVSVYLNFAATRDSSPSVIIPKYDNYPQVASEQAASEQATRALIPLKALRMRAPKEALFYPISAKSRAKREELIIPDSVGMRNQRQPVVVYSIYTTLGPLLPADYDISVQNRLGVLAMANSPVVWLTVRPQNSSEFLSKNIQPKITYMLKMVEPIGKTRPQCAIWDFTSPSSGPAGSGLLFASQNKSLTASTAAVSGAASYGVKQTGRFTTRGCEIKGVHRLGYKYDYVNCSCDHLGAVIVLMDNAANHDYLMGDETGSFRDLALVLALGVSIAILLGLLFVLSCIRGHSIKSNSNSINKNLVIILITIELLILYSILSRGSLYQREYQCKLIAIFLHYFSISLFFWLLVNAVHFYRMLTELRDINHGPMKFYHVLGYAVPAFFVTIAVGLRIEQFGNYLFCWLSIHEPIIWTMFGPISLVSMMTIILYKLALCKSLPLDKNHDDPNGVDLIKTHMLINTIKTPVIGIYWLVAVYAVNEALVDSTYLFPAVILFKSITLFLILCIVDRYIRFNLYVSWLRFKGEKAPFLDDPYGNVINPLSGSQPWTSSMMNSMPEGEFDRYGGMKEKTQTGQMLYPSQLMAPGFQSSCTDIFRPELLAGMSAASTTSRSTATATSLSSAPYREYRRSTNTGRPIDDDDPLDDEYSRTKRYRRRHGRKSHRKHHHHGRYHHHHHHHHHRSHHQDEYDLGRGAGAADDEVDDELEHGYHHGHSQGHHHHHHHRHHHRSGGGGGGGHRSQKSGGHYERSGASGAQPTTASTNGSNHDSLDNILRNDELASSHSSDEEDRSSAMLKDSIHSVQQRSKLATTTSDLNNETPPAGGSQTKLAQQDMDSSEQQQTVPMELLGQAPSGAHDQEQDQSQNVDESALDVHHEDI